MEYVEIKKVGKVVTGNTPSKKENKYYNQNYIEFVKPSNFISGKITNIKKGEEYLSYEGMKKGRTANKGDVLVTCIGNIGNVGIVEKKVCFNQQINAIKCNENYINNKYLANVIRYISPLLTHMANKAVVPILNKTQLENIKIPIFPKETQEEIANILEIIQKNIDKRKEQLLLADKLIKSRFIEMFGDPIKNEKGWEDSYLKNLSVIIMGQSPPSNSYNNIGKGLPFYQGNIDFGDKYPKLNKFCSEPLKIAKKKSILMSVRAPVGEINITNWDCCIGRGLCSLELAESLNIEYLYNYLKNIIVTVKSKSRGSTFKSINKLEIENIRVLLPPLSLQNEFSEFVTKIDKLKFEAEESLKEMENLYESLMQKFFKQN